MADTQVWIIGQSGSEWDTVNTYVVRGTEEQVRKLLADFVKADEKNYGDRFDYGDTDAEQLKKDSAGVIYAGSTLSDCHNDYTATPMMEPLDLGSIAEEEYQRLL